MKTIGHLKLNGSVFQPRYSAGVERLEKFIDSLEFDDHDHAKLYVAYAARGERVVAARDYNFGVPMMESCGYTAETLYDAAAVEGAHAAGAT